MKKFTLSFFLTIFIAFFSQSQTIWSSGNGSSASPFLIENTENLLYLAQNVNQGEKFSNTYFKLTNDIDLGCDENNPWLPIGDSLNTFNGHFDGDNHFITNIYINDSSHDNTYTGLFGNAYNATIHNVHLKEGSIIGQRIVGGICGNISGGTEISYCSNSCYIRGIGSVGGIAGSANSSYINRCVNTGSISAPGMSGGIVGNIFFINTTALEYCINSGYIKDMNFASAGISGQTFTDVKYCISIGSIDETRSPYAVAFKIGPVSNISNCFYDNQIISFTDAANIPGLNTAQLSGSALQNKIGQNSNWVFTDGLYPRINGIENISTSIVAATPTYLYYNGSNNYDNADNVIHDFNINTGNNVIWNSSNENSLSITGENVQVICQETVNNVTLTATKDNSKKDVMLTNKKVQTYNYDTVIICSTDLPLQYNDTLLIPAGAEDFQTDITSVNANGCTHHNITFFDITSYTTDIYVDTCNYYTWNGITYTTSNNYTQQFETGSGCDSVVTLHLTVNPTYAVTDNVTICQSELPYYYAPTDTTFQVGTPTLSIIHYPLSTIHGCDSTVTLNLTVNPTYAVTDNVTICQSELPYYYAPADTTFQVGTPALSIIHYTLSTIHGCDSVITLQLTVNEKPAAPTLTTTDNTTCSETGNGSITVTSPLGNEYEYSIDGRNYQATTSFNYLQEGSYTIYIRYTETGCSNSTTVSIGTTMTYPAANITTNSPLCEGTTLTLSGEGSASGENIAYAWAGPDNFFSTLLNPTCIENTTTANAGTYTLTVTNTATNCNNTAVTTVYINENSTGTDNVTICQSELPYYYAPTDTTFQVGTPPLSIIHYPLSTIHGCDSIVTLHLTVNPTYAITDNVTICQSELPYYYAPADTTFQVGTPPLSIIHYPLSTIHGCDSIVTLHLTVNPTYAITDNVTICQSELPYYYAPADTTFQVGTPPLSIIHYPLSTIHGCDSIVTLNLTVNPTYAITDNVTICQSELPYYYAPADTTFQVGTPTLSIIHYPLSTIHGCDSIVTLHLTVNPTYAITDNVTICQSELPYYYAPADTTFQVGTPPLSIIHYPLSTIHGCDSIVTLHLTVNPTYAITDNVTICQSELPYYYAPADTTFQVGTPPLSIIHYPLSTIHGCDSIVTLHLTVNPTYAITDNVTICQSELPYYYAPADTTFQVGTPPLSIIHYPLSTIHGCDSIVTLHLTVNPTYAITDNVTICQSELPYYYAPADTTFQVGTPALSIVHYPLSTIHGCDSIITLQLTVNPTYAITDNVTICQSELPYYYAPADTTFQVGTPPLSIIHYPLSTIHGCDSVITLQLTIDTICSELQTQIIPIVKGWSSISSYLAVNDTVTFEGVFENSGMQWVFDPTFGSGIVIIQNPYVNPSISLLVGVNSGTTPWVNRIGYTIYSNEANLSFTIEGLLLEDMQANITAGSWGLIPVLSKYAVNMTDILDDISGLDDSDIIYISSLSNSFMYAAGMVISSSLASLQPGLAYSVYSTKAFTIDYAAYGDKAVTANDSYMPATPWTTAAVNPNYHVIFADAKALHSMSDYIEIGDVVAAFSSTGLCVGQGYYNGEEGLCIKIYGDDAMTEEVDGMTAGEEISFKLYRPTTGETLDIVFEWSSEKAMFGNAAYQTKAFSKIIGVKNITGVEDCNSLNINIYPNPTTGNVYIAANANIKSISVYNSVGALVETMCTSSLQNATTIDLSRYSAGIYMLTITTEEGGSVIKKVVVSQ